MPKKLLIPLLFVLGCSVNESSPGSVVAVERSITKNFVILAGSDSDYFGPVHPNPFSRANGDETVKIEFSLSDSARAIVLIQNPIGEEVVRFSDSTLQGGYYKGEWDPLDAEGNALNPGLYFITVNIRNTSETNLTRPNYIQSRMLQILNN